MQIDYENPMTINIQKQWMGNTDEEVPFVIYGGWNEFDGYYVDSVEFDGEVENEDELSEQITSEFLNKMNG